MRILDTVWQDLRRGARALAKAPGFTIAAVLTLALGIGANTAIFTVVNAVLLAPLPYSQPESRVMVWSRWKGWDKTWVSGPELIDYRTRCRTLSDVAAWDTEQQNLTGDGEPIRVGVARVTTNTFRTLGAQPLVGRAFTDQEDRPGRDAVVLISHGLWQRRFGGDRAVVGHTIRLNGVSRLIVGVMPPRFQLPTDFHEDAADPTQLWIPLAVDRAPDERGNHGLYAAARLAPGATADQATAELGVVTSALTREGLYPAAMQFGAFAVPVDEEILGTIRPAILLLFGAVAFLLLIACVNVANLLLARAESRQREIALRSALGAGQWRLVRQLLTESALLASLGGLVGLGLAVAAIRLAAGANLVGLPRVNTVGIDARVLAFTVVLACATTLLFGLVPALRALRVDLVDSLKEGGLGSTVGAARQRGRAALVIAEIALAVMLAIGAGLMIRSLWALRQVDLGFDPTNVLTLRVSLPATSYDTPERIVDFYRRLVERVRALPGVERTGVIRSLPLAATIGDWGLDVEGYVETPGNNAKGDWQVASDGALEALGERLIRGRPIQASDTADSMQVAVINETMARTYWAGRDPIGGQFRMGSNNARPWVTVVGIVGDVRHNGVTGVIKEKFYRPHTQFHRSTDFAIPAMTLVIRATRDPVSLVAPVRTIVSALDADLPISSVRPMTDVVADAISTPRFTGSLLTIFAGVALALAAIGIYGLLSYVVSRRTREIGIRIAVGADAHHVLRMILGRGLALSAAGIAVGTLGGLAVTQVMVGLLRDVRPADPLTVAAAPALLGAVAAVASYIPARRATRVDALAALKTE